MKYFTKHVGILSVLTLSLGIANATADDDSRSSDRTTTKHQGTTKNRRQAPGILGDETARPRSETREQKRTERVINESKYYIGGNLGVGLISQGGGGHPDFGANAGIHFSRDISAGFFFSRVPRGSFSANETNGPSIGGAINYYGLEGQYHVARLPGLQLGTRLALGTNSIEANDNTTTSSTDFYFGPKIAYDFAITDKLTLGADGGILFGTADDSRSTATLAAALKFWIS